MANKNMKSGVPLKSGVGNISDKALYNISPPNTKPQSNREKKNQTNSNSQASYNTPDQYSKLSRSSKTQKD